MDQEWSKGADFGPGSATNILSFINHVDLVDQSGYKPAKSWEN